MKDITGQRFGRLVAIERSPIKSTHIKWEFKCDCGTIKSMRATHVIYGASKSCGCLNKELASERFITNNTKHNLSRSRFFKIWTGMKSRCENVDHTNYKTYGGRGIEVCERWQYFQNFVDDMYVEYLNHAKVHGEKNTTIDRIDNSIGYNKENCRWLTKREQSNNRRNNRIVEFNGECDTVSNMARKYGFPVPLINDRLRHGFSVERAFTQPIQYKKTSPKRER